MEMQLLTFVSICALFAAGEAIQCYTCKRHEVGGLSGGDSEDHCEEVTDNTPKSSNTDCVKCVRDTFDAPGYDYLRRYCWTSDMGTCETGEVDESLSDVKGFQDLTSYKLDRKCCTKDSCNNEYWNADAASSFHLAGSLLAVILVSILHNLN